MINQTHLVVVDDEPVARESLAAYLEREGFRVTMAEDIRGLRGVLEHQKVDLVLLDIRLPGQDGLSFLRELRSRSNLPVIFVTGRVDEIDRVLGLELGADDYVTKPFGHRELLARVRTLLRRTSESYRLEHNNLARHFAGWTLDLSQRCLTDAHGEDVRLTRGEFDILAALVRRPGQVLSRDALLDESVHRDGAPNDRTVDVLIARLRRKIETDPAIPRLIITEHGLGYRFVGPVH
ncbi:response regulator [Rhodopseudomonas palustris]|uniref:Regulatory protein VirG n=1 Tax=Rhodopseudomonas palustris (strain BisB18) TaxID=316056 RepID=Q217K5_RHOPB